MIYGQNAKYQRVLSAGAVVATNATATGNVDTLGYDYVTFVVNLDSSTAGTDNPAVLKIEEGDTTSSYAAITALTGDGTDGFVIPDNGTTLPLALPIILNVNMKGRKRHLKVSLTPTKTGGQYADVLAVLTRGDVAPITAANQGAALVVNA